MNAQLVFQANTVFYSSIIFILLWYLLFVAWRDYREQAFRQDLFELRRELFDYAKQGHISFDSSAYRSFETTVNSLIKYAYHVSFTTLVIALSVRAFSKSDYVEGLQEKITTDLALNQGQQEYLLRLHFRLILACTWQICATSFFAWPSFMLLLVAAWTRGVLTGTRMSNLKTALGKVMLRPLQYVENQAVESEWKRVGGFLRTFRQRS